MIYLKTTDIELMVDDQFQTRKEFSDHAQLGYNTLGQALKRGYCRTQIAQKIAIGLDVDLPQIVAIPDYQSLVISARGDAQSDLIEKLQAVCEQIYQNVMGGDEAEIMDDESRINELTTLHNIILKSLGALGELPKLDTPQAAESEGLGIDPLTGA